MASLFTYMSILLIVFIGLGLGASTTFKDFKHALKRPAAVCIGFLSQYLFMPVCAYLLCLIFQVSNDVAVGAVLVGCSPGGTTSNMFTYWSKGDVALSITMSFMSTAAAFFMMPLWVYVLVQEAYGSDADIAWTNLVLSLLLILIPTLLGLAIRHYNTETKLMGKFLYEWVEVAASVVGIIFLFAALVVAIIDYQRDLAEMPAKLWVMGAIMQPIGCLFGYFVAKNLHVITDAMGVGVDKPSADAKAAAAVATTAVPGHTSGYYMSPKVCRTISLETGVQNVALTIAIVNLSFEEPALANVLKVPLVYGLMYFVNSGWVVLLYRMYLAPLDTPAEAADGNDDEEVAAGDGKGGAQAVPLEEKDLELRVATTPNASEPTTPMEAV